MEWTKEQKAAIDFRENKNLLLAAAAGSGKTAVLVERILRLITDEENPVKVSSLLVLTFTEAAAAEMKRKIKSAIRRELEKNPDNELLQAQSMLISSASISTIDSFCKKKLTEYIHMTDIPSDFSVISETEADILLKQAIDEVLERYYSKIDVLPSFKELCMSIGSAKNNIQMKEMLTDLYKFSESMPYPAKWLNASVKNYGFLAKNKKNPDVWQKLLSDELKSLKNDAEECIDTIFSVIKELPKEHKYYSFYSAECEVLTALLKEFEENAYEDNSFKIRSFAFPAKVRTQKTYPEEEAKADSLRDSLKDIFEKIKTVLNSSSEEFISLSPKLFKRIKTLKNIVLCIRRKYKKLKREKSGLTFSDLEHEFLNLISDYRCQPTKVAMELRDKYTEILLDEYQDTNNIQDEIFRLISRDNKNIFMVGDLKQSIYKFRNAVPKLFSDKYKLYAEEPEKGGLIRLFKNFRSRIEVVSTVNYVFSGIMSEPLGDILYNEEEYLIRGADYPEAKDDSYETEYYIIRSSGEDEDDAVDLKEAEADFIASRISELIRSGFEVYDAKEDRLRPIEYRDIVVLLRNRSSAPVIEAVLEESSIPVYTDTGKSYLSSREVSIVLSFLSIIDNPYQDIPLIAVMRSPFFSFSNEQLAKIRLEKKSAYFYEAVVTAAENGDKLAEHFVRELDYLRKTAENSSIYKILIMIYERYDYLSLISLMSFPELRRANLRLLMLRAIEFEKTKLTGLFGFMSYLDGIKAAEKDLTPAKVMTESENVVRIMTVHKSKGLEFPVVFLSDTVHKFNTSDVRRSVLWHEEAGISIPCTDVENRINYPSLPERMLKNIKTREQKAEEMRLLYVALTRAREKLIITSVSDKKLKNVKPPLLNGEKKPVCAELKTANSFGEWLFSILALHKASKEIRDYFGFCGSDILYDNSRLKTGVVEASENIGKSILDIENSPEEYEMEFNERCEEILSFRPEKNEGIPIKVTVSEVKRRLAEDESHTVYLSGAKNIYLKEKSEFSAAERGTITHFVLQYIDEKTINSEEELKAVLEKAEEEGVISKAQREITDIPAIMRFLNSELGKRLKNSVYAQKEFSFYSEKRADEIYSGLSQKGGESPVLLQGTIDCFFEEPDGRLVLLDYKTDNIKKEEAGKRAKEYRVQLDCYKEALEKINKRKVDESYLYFLSCGEAVKIQ